MSDRLSLLNSSSFDNALSILNVSAVDFLKSQQLTSNPFKQDNPYYDIIKQVAQHNFKFYEKTFIYIFKKLKNA